MRRWFLVLIVVAAMVLALPGCESLDPGAGASQESETTRLWQKADANAALITGLTGRVGALEAQAATEVSTASFNALQNEVGTLKNTVAALTARIETLEAASEDGDGNSDGNSGELATTTRWRPRFTFDCIDTTVFDNGTVEYTYEYDPRTIKEPDVYTFTITFTNPAGGLGDTKLDDLVLGILLTPNDDTLVSDETDAYQVEGPYNVYWDTNVKTSASTGACRFIELETDSFDLIVKEGKSVVIELEFELIYE